MANAALVVKSHLIADRTLTGMLGPVGVKGGKLPKKFDPSQGQAVIVGLHTGNLHEESPALAAEIVRVRVWAGDDQVLEAWNVYARIQQLLASANMVDVAPYGFIIKSTEMSHTPMTDEETGFETVTGLFLMEIRNSV